MPVSGWCGVPANASAVVVNATVVPDGPLGALILWSGVSSVPLAASLNASDAAITSNMSIVPMASGNLTAFTSNNTQLILDVSGYFAP